METNNGFRTLAMMVALGLALAGGVVVGTAEPAEAIYVGWEENITQGEVRVIVCTGSGPDDPDATCV